MRKQFIEKALGKAKLALISAANEIISVYQEQGFLITLRQLYYQFVSRNLLTNSERSYNRLGDAVSDGRMCGLVDWSAIVDRARQPIEQTTFSGLPELVEAALESYRLDRWRGQDYYVELWVEKDALAGVLEPLAKEFHVTLMVNRGYSSTSAMYEASRRMLKAEYFARQPVILYLGDHDPSGEDMVRDVRDRLHVFGAKPIVLKQALTMEQVQKYHLPPNPAKMSDSRAKDYVAKYGTSSWEVDALPPNVLQSIIRRSIQANINRPLMDEVIALEERDREDLRRVVKALSSDREGGYLDG